MVRLKPVPFKGRGRNPELVRVLEEGFEQFRKEINRYCKSDGSHDTILGWGTEKSYLSLFSHGLNKKGRICLLEMPFQRTSKDRDDYSSDSKKYTGHVDAYIVDRKSLKNNALTMVIEAKATHIGISKNGPSNDDYNRPKKMLKKAEKQLKTINPSDISYNEQFESKKHTYKIALIFTVVKVRNAISGKGDDLEWKDPDDVIDEAKEYFAKVKRKINRKNIRHGEYYHSSKQIKLIREWYGNTSIEDGKEKPRTDAWTHYYVGALVTAALYR